MAEHDYHPITTKAHQYHNCLRLVYSTEAIEADKRQKAFEAERARRIRQERGEPEEPEVGDGEGSDAGSDDSFM